MNSACASSIASLSFGSWCSGSAIPPLLKFHSHNGENGAKPTTPPHGPRLLLELNAKWLLKMIKSDVEHELKTSLDGFVENSGGGGAELRRRRDDPVGGAAF